MFLLFPSTSMSWSLSTPAATASNYIICRKAISRSFKSVRHGLYSLIASIIISMSLYSTMGQVNKGRSLEKRWWAPLLHLFLRNMLLLACLVLSFAYAWTTNLIKLLLSLNKAIALTTRIYGKYFFVIDRYQK